MRPGRCSPGYIPGESFAGQRPAARARRASGLGVPRRALPAVELAAELVVIVGAERAWGCLVVARETAALDHPHREIDRDREEDHDEQELQHPSNVGRGWWRPTLRV